MASARSTEPEAAAGKGELSPADHRTAWHRLLQVSSRVVRAIDDALDREQRISVNEFDVLITLDNAPEHELRMTDLAVAVMLSSGGLTRLVGRLEDRGLVRRAQDPTDARAFRASLTEAGQAMLAAARITHDGVVERHLGRLSRAQTAELSRLLQRVMG